MKGAEIVYKTLQRYTNTAFIYSGGAIMPLIDQFKNKKINYYINSNEHCSALSAVGYAKSSNKIGLCITTSGPGLTNTLTGIADAQMDSIPMVVLSGQVGRKNIGTNAFQEVPAISMTKPVTKWSYQPASAGELSNVINQAFQIASTGKHGVVHIDLCKDILYEETNPDINKINDVPDILLYNFDIHGIVDVINKSKKPVIILGKGAVNYKEKVNKLCKAIHCPVTSTIHSMGIVSELDEKSLKFLGMHGHAAANFAVQSSDCIINLGSRFDDRITGDPKKFAPNAKIIQCNIHLNDMDQSIKNDYSFHGDVGTFCDLVTPLIKQNKNRKEWLLHTQKCKRKYPFIYTPSKSIPKQQEVISVLNTFLHKEKTIICFKYASRNNFRPVRKKNKPRF